MHDHGRVGHEGFDGRAVSALTHVDVLIVGAGPAGLAALDQLAARDLDILVVDEQHAAGGQFLRQPPSQFKVRRWLTESVYARCKRLLSRVQHRNNVHWELGATVIAVFPRTSTGEAHLVLVNGAQGLRRVAATQVLFCLGCYDMPVSFPGSLLPGVMTAGGVQAFVKSQQLLAGEAFVFSGTHPLQLVVADQVLKAGGTVRAVLFEQSFFRLISAAARTWTHLGKHLFIAGCLVRLLKAGVPVRFTAGVIAAEGQTQLSAVSTNTDLGRVDCDRLAICYGFLSSTLLTRQAGIEHQQCENGGGWVATHDEWMGTNIEGFFVAGEVTGVAGSDAARSAGALAALGMLRALGREISDADARGFRRQLGRQLKFARALRSLAAPDWEMLWRRMDSNTMICRCEQISFGEISRFMAGNAPSKSLHATKLFTRAGMGLCQGRGCQHMLSMMVGDTGVFTPRWPIVPVPIGRLIAAAEDRPR